MTVEAGHAPNRVYHGQDGNIHLNGAQILMEGGASESNAQALFGGSTLLQTLATIRESGNIYANASNNIAGNGSDNTDDVLDGFQLPAGAFDVAGRQVTINVNGAFAANAHNKRVKVWANPTLSGSTVHANGAISGGTVSSVGSGALLYDSGLQSGNNVGFQIDVEIVKYGASGSNTQMSIAQSMVGTTHLGSTVPAALTLPENAAINIVITGSSANSNAADVVLNQTQAVGNN